MLELAAAAFREVAAGRDLAMGAGADSSVGQDDVARGGQRMEAAAFPDAVAASGEADDRIALAHRHSEKAAERLSTRSSVSTCWRWVL